MNIAVIAFVKPDTYLYLRMSLELQPIHIHQMNYFFGRCLLLVSILLILTRSQFEVSNICLNVLFDHFCRIDLNFAIIIMQIDRLLAISTAFFHHDQVIK